jgi:hypothetical protein
MDAGSGRNQQRFLAADERGWTQMGDFDLVRALSARICVIRGSFLRFSCRHFFALKLFCQSFFLVRKKPQRTQRSQSKNDECQVSLFVEAGILE